MDVAFWVWLVTIAGLLAVLVVGLVVDRVPHEVSLRRAALAALVYVVLALVFTVGVWYFAGGERAVEFFAGYLTEYSLSVDNLFVFLIIMTRFAVPAANQHRVLLVGVMLALVMRGAFIAAGAAAISLFSWVFYVFGAFLIYTAFRITRPQREADFCHSTALRLTRRVVPVTAEYDGARIITRVDGRRVVTPMLLVMIAIGTTDLLFALDSIPAIFGLTKEPYLVFTANIFALFGLRQLYFLIGGLLDRLVYLSKGLAVLLVLIGVKLIVEALHGSGVDVPEISPFASLTVIVVILAITVIASMLKERRDRRRPAPAAQSASPAREKGAHGE